MGLLRDRHNDEQGAGVRRFQMREKLLAVGDDYWIDDESGSHAFLVDGKAMRIRQTFVMKDAGGNEVATIKEHKLSVRDNMHIEVGGRDVSVKKALVGIRERFAIDVDGGSDLKAHGNIVDHEYEIEGDHGTVATVSKKWFRVRDTYGVEVQPGVDPVLVLAITVAIDAMEDRH